MKMDTDQNVTPFVIIKPEIFKSNHANLYELIVK